MSNSIKKREGSFTIVSNSFLRDDRISFKAKGLFCYMFSMNENWNFTIRSIATQQKDGEASIISAMNELKEFNFIEYTKHQNGSGTYFLNDEPNIEKPNVENPNLGKSTRIKEEQLTKKTNTSDSLKLPKSFNGFIYPEAFTNLWKIYSDGSKSEAYKSYLLLAVIVDGKVKLKDEFINPLLKVLEAEKQKEKYKRHLSTILRTDIISESEKVVITNDNEMSDADFWGGSK